jgi:uncharacterized protein (DUF58 family)
MPQYLQFMDPADLARIKDLQLLARSVVEGVTSGLHRSPHAGTSVEFAQYRPYAQGDDLKHVDWRLYGRTDRLHIKQFQDETNLRCTIILDCSASMDYGWGVLTKFRYAQMLAACLAYLLSRQRDEVGLIAYREGIQLYLPPRLGTKHLRRILAELEGFVPDGTTDTAGTLGYLGNVIRPRGMVVLISDLLHPLDETIDHLRSLRARRQDVMVLQISDPSEQTFPFDRTVTLLDAEGAGERYAIPEAVREQYLENRRNHFDRIRRECLAEEIDIEEFCTDRPLDHALHFFLQHRNRTALRSSRIQRGRVGGRR